MIPVKQLGIAVIGDENLVNGMRLAGVGRYHLIADEHDVGEAIKQALAKLIDDPEVGIIVMPEDYAEHAGDLLAQVKAGKGITPVVIEVPSIRGTRYGDTKEYYKAYVRKFIGFDVEI